MSERDVLTSRQVRTRKFVNWGWSGRPHRKDRLKTLLAPSRLGSPALEGLMRMPCAIGYPLIIWNKCCYIVTTVRNVYLESLH